MIPFFLALDYAPEQGEPGVGTSVLLFRMRRGKPISALTLPKMLQYHRIPAVAHDIPSSFRDWVAEDADHAQLVIEAAYARSDLFERRRRLMDDWAEYLAGVR